jgi:hypothetical protein
VNGKLALREFTWIADITRPLSSFRRIPQRGAPSILVCHGARSSNMAIWESAERTKKTRLCAVVVADSADDLAVS